LELAQAYDDALLTKGTHSLKFGFAFERMFEFLPIPIRTAFGNSLA